MSPLLDTEAARLSQPDPLRIVLIAGWALIVLSLGGIACGLGIVKLGALGAISLWGLGALAGFIGNKIIGEKSRPVGWLLVVACVVAFVVAEVCWIHWKTVQGEASWLEAIKLLPTFFQVHTVSALIGLIFCAFGAMSAYRQVAVRYRIVRIVEE